jgi:hypothetical protein
MSLLVIPAVALALEIVVRRSAVLWPVRGPLRLLLAFFCAIVLTLYGAAMSGLLPQSLHAGGGVLRFASDSFKYQAEAETVANGLRHGALRPLVEHETLLYSKFLGIVYAAVGSAPLAGMLFNAVFYLASLVSVYLVARRFAGEEAAGLSLWMAGLWPGFWLHATQTFRWVETTAALHVGLAALVLLVGGASLRVVVAGLVAAGVLLLDAPYMIRVLYWVLGALAMVLGLFAIRRPAWRPAAVRVGAAAVVLLVAFYAVWVLAWSSARTDPLTALVEARLGFDKATVPGATALTADPQLLSAGELLRNLPAAYLAAFFAPDPATLLAETPGMFSLRRYVVVEVLVYYALLPFTVFGAVQVIRRAGERDRLPVLLLLAVMLAVYGVLGTVVTNGGTLYRFRLPYVLMQFTFTAVALGTVAAAWRRRHPRPMEVTV